MLPLILTLALTPLWAAEPPTITAITPNLVEAKWAGQALKLRPGDTAGPWTLMVTDNTAAIFENFSDQNGDILFITIAGVQLRLPKSSEPTSVNPATLYRGNTLAEVLASEHDLLATEILARGGDPKYADVAAALPPIATMRTHTFAGTHESRDKVAFNYGGRTAHFDPAVYAPGIRAIVRDKRVRDGLIGGWLPVVRFVYPEPNGDWWEMAAFAPPRMDNANDWIQPVWYRVARIENGGLKWARYFDSYHPFPPRAESRPAPFFRDLQATHDYWTRMLAPAMTILTPDPVLTDMARHSLVRAMITRIGAQPKYGVTDRNYGGNEHDGFPDTFTADTTAMLDWGLFDLARDYLDNYFSKFVRDDGSILYRGPETGQYGRMLTVVAQYASYTGDTALLLRLRSRIDGIARLLLALRQEGLKKPKDDPAHGLISGWSEADSCLDPEPSRYIEPYFGNSTEAARGFRDLGRVWERAGLTAWGKQLQREAEALNADVARALDRSINGDFIPCIAGLKTPYPDALTRDKLDPQYRCYRTYTEMMSSGSLSRRHVEMIADYRAAHRDTLLGVPTAYGYGTGEMAGFLTYGHAYGLLQHDLTERFLLTLHAIRAHQYTRGAWVAPETRNIGTQRGAAPYCTPAQLVVPMLTRWMLAFDDPESNTVWLAKAVPREWLEDGQGIAVNAAPTRFGKLSYKLASHIAQGRIEATVSLPVNAPFAAQVKLKLRLPAGNKISAVEVNGRPSTSFNANEQTVTLAPGMTGDISVSVRSVR